MAAPAINQEERDRIRALILSGICPECGKGPFKKLAHHTSITHGIDKRQLRDMGGFCYTESICDPELSARYRERNRNDPRYPGSAGGRPFGGATPHGPMSVEARRRLAERMKRMHEAARDAQPLGQPPQLQLSSDDRKRLAQEAHSRATREWKENFHRAGGRASTAQITHNQRVRYGQKAALKNGRLTPADVRIIRGRLSEGESVRTIAQSYGVAPATIYDIRNHKTWTWITESGKN